MPTQDLLDKLKQGVQLWNRWREYNLEANIDLNAATLINECISGANLSGAYLGNANLMNSDLRKANLSGADLTNAYLVRSDLRGANLSRAILSGAYLNNANLSEANIRWANLTRAKLSEANLIRAHFRGANLRESDFRNAKLNGANFRSADLKNADFRGADLEGAKFIEANLNRADFSRANLEGANLTGTQLIGTNLRGAIITGSSVYGVSVWKVLLEDAEQRNLVITPNGKPTVTVDNLEVAQFIYLLLNNAKIRDVINTITSKAVLILGRFTPKRKAILDAIRDELRKRNYLPILFDFDIPIGRDITETVTLLARISRFIIADLTEPSSIPKELEAIIPTLAVPVQPLLEGIDESISPYIMFRDYWKYDWLLPLYQYEGLDGLLSTLELNVIEPAEMKAAELVRRRAGLYA